MTGHPLHTDWSTAATAERRNRYYAASQQKFVPFKDPLVFKKGSMQYLWDADGKKYIDLLAMNVCVSVGHAHPTVVNAAMTQAQDLTHCTTMFYHPVPAHFAEELAATMPKGHDWVVHFTNSGSEAIDLAMAMARTYTGHLDLLALRTAYHGPTAGAQSLTGIAGFRHPGMPGNVAFVAEPNQYRGIYGPGAAPYLDEIERVIASATTGKVAGIFVESVQGYGGIIEMPAGYMSGAAERVRAAGGLYIADEVQSGFGRTGDNMWGFEADGVVPDIVVMAKGIGNGFPLGAVVAKKAIGLAMADKFMFHTYGANPTSCAAGRAVLQVIREEKTQENARKVGGALLARLKDLQQKHKAIGDVRGSGLMLAIEMVKDRKTKEPDAAVTAAVFENCREQGLILSKSGPDRSVLRMVPPMCLSIDDVDKVAEGLDQAFKKFGVTPHPIIALWSHPRSMSTAFERIMRSRGDLQCLHEPFMYDYYVHRSTRVMPHFDVQPEHPRSYTDIRALILDKARNGPVFFKDMSYYVMPHLMADESFALEITHTFLIRDPTAAIVSYAKLDPEVSLAEIGLEAQWRHVEAIRSLTGKAPVVVQSERVQNDPEGQMKAYWSAVGLSDTPQALHFGEEVPADWQQVSGWHQDVMASTSIRPWTDEDVAKTKAQFEALAKDKPHFSEYHAHHAPFHARLAAMSQ